MCNTPQVGFSTVWYQVFCSCPFCFVIFVLLNRKKKKKKKEALYMLTKVFLGK